MATTFPTEYDNEIFEELAYSLVNDHILGELQLTQHLEFSKLDYSLDSLKAIDNYLHAVYENPGSDEDNFKTILRCGAYLGEVLRRNAPIPLNWVQYDKASETINEVTNGAGKQLATLAILVHGEGGITFPIAKPWKYLSNSSEDSTAFFAQAMLSSWSN